MVGILTVSEINEVRGWGMTPWEPKIIINKLYTLFLLITFIKHARTNKQHVVENRMKNKTFCYSYIHISFSVTSI